MESKMITKRIFLTISVIMFLVLFLFQFTGIVRRKYNDYESNSYKEATATSLTKSDEFQVLTNKTDVILSTNKYIVYIGDISDRYGNTVYQWCRLSKKNLMVYSDITQYHVSGWNRPEMVIVDSNYMDYDTQMDTLEEISDMGVNVTLCTLPEYDITRKNKRLMEYCGISNWARKITASGIRVFEDFLLGGEIWFTPENDPEGMYNNLNPVVPWYTTTTGTKTYMAAELSDEYENIDNEDQPSLIWRKRCKDSYVFCVNGDFISDISGIGLLSAILYESKDYDIYPVVDAQTFVVANFPYFSSENDNAIQKFYGKNTSGFTENVVWPDLSNLSTKLQTKMTFMAAPQLNYSDRKLPSVNELDYFFRLIREQRGEVGLTSSKARTDILIDKLEADKGFYRNYVGGYDFLSIRLKKDELKGMKNINNDILKDVKTYVTGSDEYVGSNLFSYYDDDKLLIESPVSAEKYNFSEDFKLRCINTALAYTNIDMDVWDIYFPTDEEKLWNKYIKNVSSSVENLLKGSKNLTQCTVSELDKRVRELLSLNYSYRMDNSSLVVDIDGNQEISRFLYRSHKDEIESVVGGTFTRVEDGAYIITATEKRIEINFK